MQISVCKLVGEWQSIVTIWDHLFYFYFFHVLNGFSLLGLTTTAEISLSHKFRRANTILWALSLSEAFNNAIQLYVFSAYQLSQGTLKKMKSALLKPKKKLCFKRQKARATAWLSDSGVGGQHYFYYRTPLTLCFILSVITLPLPGPWTL